MHVSIFKTFPLKLKDWDDLGVLHRETKPFREISMSSNIRFTIISYESIISPKYIKKLIPIEVVPAFKYAYKKTIFKYIASLFVPFNIGNIIKNSNVLQTNQFWGVWILLIVKLIYKKKIILRQGFNFYYFVEKSKKNYFLKVIIKLLVKIAYHYCDKLIVTTDTTKKSLINNFNVNSKKINVIPNYIDTKIFKKIKNINKQNKILCVGRLAEQKNYEFLFKILSNSNIEIDIIGHGDQNKYRKIAEMNNVKVNFLGNIKNENLPKYYNSYKVFVLCSLYEGNPKSLLEAMSCECTCICSDVNGIKELSNGKNFELIDLKYPKTFLKTIKKYIEGKEEQNSDLGYYARKFIEGKFSLEKIKEEYLRIYKNI